MAGLASGQDMEEKMLLFSFSMLEELLDVAGTGYGSEISFGSRG